MDELLLHRITEAILYEGHILYPYRPSSKKNVHRFTFGRVYPEQYALHQNGAEPSMMQTECLLHHDEEFARLDVQVRFLHPRWRKVGLRRIPVAQGNDSKLNDYTIVPDAEIGGKFYQSWQEVTERRVIIPTLRLGVGKESRFDFPFSFDAERSIEPVCDEENRTVAVLQFSQHRMEGIADIAAVPIDERVSKITVCISNTTQIDDLQPDVTVDVLMRTFISTHSVLHVTGGEFFSSLDPPPLYTEAARRCVNLHTYPVLVGSESKQERDTMLSSPIILYDYPKIAPESPGNLFDGTEIDEILTLRIMTMTDDEKKQMKNVEESARRILERSNAISPDRFMKLHGSLTSSQVLEEEFFNPSNRLDEVEINGIHLKTSGRVRIKPNVRADIMDMALQNKIGVVEAIEEDVEGKLHIAVIVEDDPGKDLGTIRQPGHRFFFSVDELEPLEEGE